MDTDEHFTILRELSGYLDYWQSALSALKCGDLFMVEDRGTLILKSVSLCI